ncbi:unnamed protein product [Brachionus calyciflorus]|uniref:Uncharacterized protein n=1 Tax=Brachionus calyciflorus TaxID=104777 RepID=A0A813XT54_9BILA|nr:unnamed protein product [Brachionus calyciflorus]
MNYLVFIIVFVQLIVEYNSQTINTRQQIFFSRACSDFIDNEILFFGTCKFSQKNYETLVELTDFVRKSDPNLVLDDFLRNKLAYNSTFFFRTQYSNETEYIKRLDSFTVDFLKVVDGLKNSLSNVKVSDFFEASQTSNFTSVLNKVVDWRDDLVNVNVELYNMYFCSRDFINLCSSTKELLLDIKYIDEISDRTVFNFSSFFFDSSFKSIKNIFLLQDNYFIQEKLKEIDSKGTSGTILREVHEIIDTQLFQKILEFFSGVIESPTPTRKSTTQKTTKTTTRRVKVVETKAVSTSVIILVGTFLLGIGIFASIVVAYLEFKNKSRKRVRPNNQVSLQMKTVI